MAPSFDENLGTLGVCVLNPYPHERLVISRELVMATDSHESLGISYVSVMTRIGLRPRLSDLVAHLSTQSETALSSAHASGENR